ncbi:uncharacterized protein LOC134290293 [Aedes albopictus]|uniref:Uncharacterized protein n=1 Tax=Aedes albopictus TaxID=7160 RepID=A0ABM1YGB9_AEDAL
MNTGSIPRLPDPNETAYNCGKCNRPDEDESQMVFCDNCQRWYHFGCQGVTSDIQEDHDWVCSDCSGDQGGRTPDDPEERELLEAEKSIALERERLSALIEKKKRVASMRLKLEIEKREALWQLEKQELEAKAVAVEEFNEKKRAEKEKLQRRIDKALSERAELENEESSIRFCKKTSTPMVRMGEVGEKSKISKVKANAVREKVVDTDATSESESESKSDGDTSDASAKMELVPTKAQLSARQFLARRLPTFTGNPEEWSIFISSYETTTKACGFSNLENLVRLQECLKGAALDAVGSRLLLPQFVPKVIQELREQFGQPEQILETLLVKVRSADGPKAERPATFITYGRLVQQLCDHMEATHLEDHLTNPLLISELAKKLPASTKMDWIRFKRNEISGRKKVTLRTMADFLSEIVSVATEAVNLVDGQASSSRAPNPERNRERNKPKQHGVYVNVHNEDEKVPQEDEPQKRIPCAMCGETNHRLRNCDDFLKLEPAQRLKAVDRWELCRSCLNAHGDAKCKINIRCKVANCQGLHNTLLHQLPVHSTCNMHNSILPSSVIFRVVPVTVYNGSKTLSILAFLDEGSSYTLIEASVAEELGCGGVVQPLRVSWTAGMTRLERDSKIVNLSVSSVGSTQKSALRGAHTVRELGLPKQTMRFAEFAEGYEHLQGLQVADYPMETPRILIGLKHLHLFAPLESRIGNPGEPIAVRSMLGWTVYGPQEKISSESTFVGHHTCTSVSNEDLYRLLKSHYVLEDSAVLVDLVPESRDDRRAREILEKTTVRVGDRFQCGLLWKEEHTLFPDSFSMAEKRMKSLEKRLAKNQELQQNVHKQMSDYIEKGYCHKATPQELRSTERHKVWYLPLNIVLNPRKPGKVRLVWDAAAAVNGVSLNATLLKGPDLLVSLPSVISQFRERRIGFGGDIREMFHQIRIRPEDRQAQRFLFGGEVYVMDCAIFGATCSPSQALYVMNKNASEFSESYPEAASAIEKKHYVDDYFDSVDSTEEAICRAKEVRDIHARGGFQIRNWVSNSEEVLMQLGERQDNQEIHFHRDKETEYERVLGIVWNTKQDVFTFSTKVKDELQPYLTGGHRPTKRIVLSCVMSFFDPLGLLAVFTIHGRIIVQDLWRSGCDWDEEIDDEALVKWSRWTACLTDVEMVEIPRYYFSDAIALNYGSLQLHIFVDASENAYGAVGYFRILTGRDPCCALVQARSKVAPIKPHSIPRLELMADVLGARLKDTILESHNFEIKKVYFWTDSRTVQSWIKSDARKYRQFVAFRIGDILSRTKTSDWRWISTKLNVADHLTKWSRGSSLEADGAWLKGPAFLHLPESEWPVDNSVEPNDPEELRATCLFHKTEAVFQLIDPSRISKWNVLVRCVACVIRFISNLRRKAKGLAIETLRSLPRMKYTRKVHAVRVCLQRDEFQRAEEVLWQQVQMEAFEDEVRILRIMRDNKGECKEKIEKRSPLYKLSPILDENDVVRVEGRTAQAEFLPFEMRFPIILPKGHMITTRLIEHYHGRLGHGHREAVVNELMQRFCIPKIRAEVSRVMRNCVWCKVYKCKPTVPRMAPLPVQRATPFLRPFTYTGVDFFGPISVVIGRRSEKRWVSLFTCLTTRAIHLEVARSLSTASCLMAIRRFVCRRGFPIEFFSNNGTNFVGASKEIIKAINEECSENLTSSRTRWNFNPPAAPHMGGIWERLVRSVKAVLAELDDGRSLSDEVLETVLAEAERMINSRPLTFVSKDNMEPEALTPNHFLLGYPSCGREMRLPSGNEAKGLRDQYERSQVLTDKLWNRWIKEYLPTINLRSKWQEDQGPIKVGTLVYMADEENRKSWIRGVVDEIIKGADGRVRQVVIRAGGKRYRRAVAKIAVPEISDETPGLV